MATDAVHLIMRSGRSLSPDPTKLRYEHGANAKKRRLVGRSAFQKRPALVRG